MEDKLELSNCGKYSIGSTVWYLDFQHTNSASIGEEYDEFHSSHPIFLFKRTPVKSIWKTSRTLPRLEHNSFDLIMGLITGKLEAKSIVVDFVELDETTGDFVYSDDSGEIYLPEIVLFETNREALRERTRVLNMIKDWVAKQIGTNYDLFSMRKSSEKQQDKCSNRRTRRNHNKKQDISDNNTES